MGTIWISGLAASGKTTLSKLLVDDLKREGVDNIILLDGEDIRKHLSRKYSHSLEDRFAVIDEIIQIASKFVSSGLIPVIATISHIEEMRQKARRALNPFMEICLTCSVENCAIRDYKDVYTLFNKGNYVAGLSDPYEVSKAAELIIDTGTYSIEESRKKLLSEVRIWLQQNENISNELNHPELLEV